MAARSAGRSRGIFKGFRRRLAPDAARSAKRASLYSSRSQLSLPIIAAKRPFVKKNRHFPGLAFRKTWRSSFLEAALPPRLPPKRVVLPSLCRRRRLRLSKNPGVDKGPQPLMFHPALTTSASERRKTRRFSYLAGFAARERMREAKPVKARKSGAPPLFRHSEAAVPLFLLPEGRSRVPRDKAVRSLP